MRVSPYSRRHDRLMITLPCARMDHLITLQPFFRESESPSGLQASRHAAHFDLSGRMLEAKNLGRDTHLLFAGYQRCHTAGQGKQEKIKPSFLGTVFTFYTSGTQTVRVNDTPKRRGKGHTDSKSSGRLPTVLSVSTDLNRFQGNVFGTGQKNSSLLPVEG